MEISRVASGSKILDYLLKGGYERDVITTLYGPAGAGKTCLCMLASAGVARKGRKVIYIDTEGGFSLDRLRQIAPDYKKVLSNTIFLRPMHFNEQKKAFAKLKDIVDDRIGLIVVDTISMLYRLERGKNGDAAEVNRELGRQISYLNEIARARNIPILVANQVYANFDDKTKTNIVGGDLLKYGSKCLIELQKTPANNRKAILRKHRSIMEEKEMLFRIVDGGIIGTKESKFKLF